MMSFESTFILLLLVAIAGIVGFIYLIIGLINSQKNKWMLGGGLLLISVLVGGLFLVKSISGIFKEVSYQIEKEHKHRHRDKYDNAHNDVMKMMFEEDVYYKIFEIEARPNDEFDALAFYVNESLYDIYFDITAVNRIEAHEFEIEMVARNYIYTNLVFTALDMYDVFLSVSSQRQRLVDNQPERIQIKFEDIADDESIQSVLIKNQIIE
jgi:hypothetical protein